VIIARNADQAAFEAFWQVTLPPGTVFINSGDKMPSINGDETFTLQDGAGGAIDGPSAAMGKGSQTNFQRKQPLGPAADAGSWVVVEAKPGTAGPGGGCQASGEGLFVSEFSDAGGSGNFIYEFVELCYSGEKP
jgi:hypothetical protein